jgi:glycosyltransferase involved in cell wall biosynthesis
VRILLVSDWMSNAGGSEAYITGLQRWLVEAGDDARLLTCGGDGNAASDIRAFGTDNVVAQSVLQLYNPFAVAAVRRAVREFRPDAALVSQFVYHLSPLVLSALGSVPTVVSIMDYKVVCPIGSKLLPDGRICREPAGTICRRKACVGTVRWLRDQPRYALVRAALRKSRRILCASGWMQAELARNGIESECLPIPVEPPPSSFVREPAEQPTFVYVGRLSREKGLDVLVAAFAQLLSRFPLSRLRIVGDGPLREEVRHLVTSHALGDTVHFTGRLAPAGVESMLRDAWALVAPSTWAEPYGLVAAEAILRGVPVVASSDGGFAETVQQRVSGLLVPNRDVSRLASALEEVASGRAFPGQQIPADVVSRLAERLSPPHHVERLHQIWSQER